MSDALVFIYGLTDSGNRIKYVGQAVTPKQRFERHLRDLSGTPKSKWIQAMIAEGHRPGLVILDCVPANEANYREKWWIVLGNQRGWELTNTGNPSSRKAEFGEMFAEALRNGFDQFKIENDPVIMLTRRHTKLARMVVKFALSLLAAVLVGYMAYQAELMANNEGSVPMFYALVGFLYITGLGFLWSQDKLEGSLGRKLLAIHVVPLVLALGIQVINWFTR